MISTIALGLLITGLPLEAPVAIASDRPAVMAPIVAAIERGDAKALEVLAGGSISFSDTEVERQSQPITAAGVIERLAGCKSSIGQEPIVLPGISPVALSAWRCPDLSSSAPKCEVPGFSLEAQYIDGRYRLLLARISQPVIDVARRKAAACPSLQVPISVPTRN